MKKLTVFICFFILIVSECAALSESQSIVSVRSEAGDVDGEVTYHPFLNNSKWFKTYIAEGVHSTFYFMSGDTIIDSMLYYKINQRNIKLPGVLNNPNIRLWNINFNYPYLFREDIENKKVFVRSGKSESLLYDFNLKVGDIMPDNSSFRLIKIDSVEINSGIRKRFTFQSAFADYTAVWIEGVGNTAHPFINYMYVVGQQDINQLLCAYQNDNIIYENCILSKSETKLVECIDYYNSETGYQNVEINGCKISPNPTNGKVNISLPNGTLNSIRVIDVNGRVLRDYRYDLTESTVSIDISSFASGVYYCVVATEHETGTYKVIKF